MITHFTSRHTLPLSPSFNGAAPISAKMAKCPYPNKIQQIIPQNVFGRSFFHYKPFNLTRLSPKSDSLFRVVNSLEPKASKITKAANRPPLNDVSAAKQTPASRKIPNDTYESVTANLSKDQLEHLDREIERLPNKENQISALCEGIKKNTLFTLPLFFDPKFHRIALAALKAKAIDGTSFTTCTLFNNQFRMTNPDEILVIPLFTKNKPNTIAWEIIAETARKNSGKNDYRSEDKSANNQSTFLDEEQLKKFMDLMRSMPEFEQQFLLFPEPKPSQQVENTRQAIIQKLGSISYNVFMHVPFAAGEPKHMLASKSMYQLFLFAQNEKLAPDLLTSIGLSSRAKIIQQVPSNQHDMCLEIPEDPEKFPPVDNVDGYDPIKKLQGAFKHDGYHAQIILYMPIAVRQRFASFSKLFEVVAEKNKDKSNIQIIANEFAFVLGEGEHRIYEDNYEILLQLSYLYPFIKNDFQNYLEKSSDKDEFFWKSVNFRIQAIVMKFGPSNEVDCITCVESVLREIILNADHYKKTANIDIGTLLEFVFANKEHSVFVDSFLKIVMELSADSAVMEKQPDLAMVHKSLNKRLANLS